MRVVIAALLLALALVRPAAGEEPADSIQGVIDQQIAETPEGLVQTVLFQDRRGRLHEAAYLMRQVDGVWRVNGVQLSALPGVGA